MPNYVKNRITLLNGESVEEALKDVLTKDENGKLTFDFNKLIPMPKELDIESSSNYEDYFKVYLNTCVDDQKTFDKLIKTCLSNNPYDEKKDYILSEKEIEEIYKRYKSVSKEEMLKVGEQIANNLLKYKAKDWYDWDNRNWGTKWNACDCGIYDNVIEFDTAWNFPTPIAKKLFKKYPKLNIEWIYSEEQICCYGGYMKQIDGKIEEKEFEEDSKEMYENAFELWGCEGMYRYNEESGTYEFDDGDYEDEDYIDDEEEIN